MEVAEPCQGGAIKTRPWINPLLYIPVHAVRHYSCQVFIKMNISWKCRFRVVLMLLAVAISLSGCSTPRVDVSITGFTDPSEPPRHTFVVVPEDETTSAESLEFKAYSRLIDKVMVQAGFEKAASRETADMAVLLSYSVSGPNALDYTYQEPIYEKTGERTVTSGEYKGHGKHKTYESTTTTEPVYTVTGYNTLTGTKVIYNRRVYLVAVKMERYLKKQIDELWRLQALSDGAGGDLRTVFPYMAVAFRPYLGKDTDVDKKESVNMGDGRVKRLVAED